MAPASVVTCPHCDSASAGAAVCTTCARPVTVCGGVRIGAEIDRGGVARIHGGTTPHGADAAVKILERTSIHSPAVHRLFARSARLLSDCSHPALPRVLGFETNRRRSFFAMERLQGGTLWARVAQRGKFHGADVETLLHRLLQAIAYLHGRGLVHGDITPRNVMFRTGDDTQPVLVDFDGLCTDGERDVASLVMTPGYSAPEQRVGELGPGSDLYGVGASVVFAITGKAPDRLERVGEHMDLDLGGVELAERTRDVLQRLVALDPMRRPKSAKAALDALVVSTPAARAQSKARWALARLLFVAALIVLVLVVAAGLVALTGTSPARPM